MEKITRNITDSTTGEIFRIVDGVLESVSPAYGPLAPHLFSQPAMGVEKVTTNDVEQIPMITQEMFPIENQVAELVVVGSGQTPMREQSIKWD